jgi:hypothetical protein
VARGEYPVPNLWANSEKLSRHSAAPSLDQRHFPLSYEASQDYFPESSAFICVFGIILVSEQTRPIRPVPPLWPAPHALILLQI